MRTCLALLCSIFLATILPAQEGKVVVVNSELKDLKRTAYRMRIPVERLKNARQALKEATDQAKRVDPLPFTSFPQMGNYWVVLHRAKAKDSIQGLVSLLRTAALNAREARQYTEPTSAAGRLLVQLSQLDADQALQTARKWPQPSQSLGDAARESRSEMERQFRQGAARGIAGKDPDAALALNAAGSEPVDFYLRSTVADTMLRAGRKEEAVWIMEKTISDLSSIDAGQIEPTELNYLMHTLSRVAPERFPEAFRLIVASASTAPLTGEPSLKFDGRTIPLDNTEAVAINLLRDIQRPTLVTGCLDLMPGLKSKLEPVGGIDRVLAEGPAELSVGTRTGMETSMHYGPDSSSGDQRLYAQMGGKDSGFIREKLSGLSPSREQIFDLLSMANSAALENPELSSLALEQARRLTERLEPLSARIQIFPQLLRFSRRCEGEVDPELYKSGFAMIARIREEEASLPKAGNRTSNRSGGDMLERALISELAIDDFERALRYVREMPEGQLRISGLMALVDASRRPF